MGNPRIEHACHSVRHQYVLSGKGHVSAVGEHGGQSTAFCSRLSVDEEPDSGLEFRDPQLVCAVCLDHVSPGQICDRKPMGERRGGNGLCIRSSAPISAWPHAVVKHVLDAADCAVSLSLPGDAQVE